MIIGFIRKKLNALTSPGTAFGTPLGITGTKTGGGFGASGSFLLTGSVTGFGAGFFSGSGVSGIGITNSSRLSNIKGLPPFKVINHFSRSNPILQSCSADVGNS